MSAIKRYALDKQTWTKKGAHSVSHYFFVVGLEATSAMVQYYGDASRIAAYYIKDNYGYWCWSNEELARLREQFLKRIKEEPSFVNKLLEDWTVELRRFDKIMEQVDRTKLANLSNQELVALYEQFHEQYANEYAIAVNFQDAFSLFAEEFLRPHFKTVLPEKNFEEHYLLLTSPVTLSFITAEYIDRLRIANHLREGHHIEEEVAKHVQQYFWIRNNYASGKGEDSTYFRPLIEKAAEKDTAKEIARLEKEPARVAAAKKKLLDTLQLDEYSQILILVTETFAYMQDERKKYMMKAISRQEQFLQEVSRRTSITLEDLKYSIPPELPRILAGEQIDYATRKQGTLALFTHDGYELVYGKEANDLFTQAFIDDHKEVTELSGTIACKGKASGRAKIIRKKHDFASFQQGDVLIASMTRPDMAVIMEKAAAIVTDEGGITCHAAVVSREMNTPCIIGTKRATEVFKDGDSVLVDAEKGIISLLARPDNHHKV